MESIIHVENLVKEYTIPVRQTQVQSWINAVRFQTPRRVLHALRGISFDIASGEFVGYIGPNGSGKTTTIKCLSGVLVPTRGQMRVLGYVPWKQRVAYTQHIGVLFGQKSLLLWDLPVRDSFRLHRDIYGLDRVPFGRRLAEFEDIFDLKDLLERPVRKLSLGQRMRCELVAALLHSPKVVFLDEPTIGLDLIAKERIHSFLKYFQEQEKLTVLLTTHQIDEIEALCQRIIILSEGQIVYDGDQSGLRASLLNVKNIRVSFKQVLDQTRLNNLLTDVRILDQQPHSYKLEIDLSCHSIRSIVTALMDALEIIDINVSGSSLEEVVKWIYQKNQEGSSPMING